MRKTKPALRILAFLLILAGLVKITGCEPEDFVLNTNCNDCLSYWPDSANLIFLLTVNEENPAIPIEVYRGSIEDQQLDWVDTARTDRYELYSEIGQVYSVKAVYKDGSKTVFAYDSDHLYSYIASDECWDGCILVKGGVFDLRLKK